jgi:MFS family permease
VIVGLFMLMATLVAIPVGRVSDRLGRRVVLAVGVGIGLLVSAALPFAQRIGALMALYAVAGVGVAAFTPVMMAYIGDIASPGMMGRAYGWLTTAQYAGMAVGPAVGGMIVGHGGFSRAFLGSAAVLAVALAVIVGGLPAPADQQALSTDGRIGAALISLIGNPRVVGCWAAVFTTTFAWGASLSFFPLYAQDEGMSPLAIGLCFAAQAAANTVGRPPLGRLLDRTESRAPFIGGGMALFGLAIAGIVFLRGPWSLSILSAVQGLAMGTAMVAVGTALGEVTSPATRGVAMGGYGTAIYAGLALSSWSLGWLILHHGYQAGFFAAGGAALVGMGVCLWLFARSRMERTAPALRRVREKPG